MDLDLGPPLGVVDADADRFHQIVWSVISNAIEFTPKGGEVQRRLRAEQQHVSIAVQDSRFRALRGLVRDP